MYNKVILSTKVYVKLHKKVCKAVEDHMQDKLSRMTDVETKDFKKKIEEETTKYLNQLFLIS